MALPSRAEGARGTGDPRTNPEGHRESWESGRQKPFDHRRRIFASLEIAWLLVECWRKSAVPWPPECWKEC